MKQFQIKISDNYKEAESYCIAYKKRNILKLIPSDLCATNERTCCSNLRKGLDGKNHFVYVIIKSTKLLIHIQLEVLAFITF